MKMFNGPAKRVSSVEPIASICEYLGSFKRGLHIPALWSIGTEAPTQRSKETTCNAMDITAHREYTGGNSEATDITAHREHTGRNSKAIDSKGHELQDRISSFERKAHNWQKEFDEVVTERKEFDDGLRASMSQILGHEMFAQGTRYSD